jgi:hypothetical protein
MALLAAAALACASAAPWAGEQRVTLCPCNGQIEQRWIYPPYNETGRVLHGLGDCLALVEDGCAWGPGGVCIELRSKVLCNAAPPAGATPFLVRAGFRNGTVTLEVPAANLPAGWPSANGCMDINAQTQAAELYPCYSSENKNQEFIEAGNASLIEQNFGTCLCIDTSSRTASPSSSASSSSSSTSSSSAAPTASSSGTRRAAASRSSTPTASPAGGSAATVGAGVVAAAVFGSALGLAVVGAVGFSFATGTPLTALAARAAAAVGVGGGSSAATGSKAGLVRGAGYAGSGAASSRAAALGTSLPPRGAEKISLLAR